MPAHAVLALLCLLLSVLAAVAALLYAAVPTARRTLRWPLVALAALAFATAVSAGEAGSTLLTAVEATGAHDEVVAAQAHAHGSDLLTTVVFLLLVAVLATVWGPLHPAKGRRGVWAAVVGVLAVGTLVAAAVVLTQALQAVTAGNPAWHVG